MDKNYILTEVGVDRRLISFYYLKKSKDVSKFLEDLDTHGYSTDYVIQKKKFDKEKIKTFFPVVDKKKVARKRLNKKFRIVGGEDEVLGSIVPSLLAYPATVQVCKSDTDVTPPYLPPPTTINNVKEEKDEKGELIGDEIKRKRLPTKEETFKKFSKEVISWLEVVGKVMEVKFSVKVENGEITIRDVEKMYHVCDAQ